MKTIAVAALLAFAPVALAEPDLRPRLPKVIRDTSQLVRATESDPEVHQMAKDLDGRRSASTAFTVLSLAAGLGLTAVAFAFPSCQDTAPRDCTPRYNLIAIGGGITAVGGFLGWGGAPRREHYDAVQDRWNERHPDQPIDVR